MYTQLLFRSTSALYGLCYGNPRKTITAALLEFELGICFVLLGYLGAIRCGWISLGISGNRNSGYAFSEVGFILQVFGVACNEWCGVVRVS